MQRIVLAQGTFRQRDGERVFGEVVVLIAAERLVFSVGLGAGMNAVSVELTPEQWVGGNYDDVILGLKLERVKAAVAEALKRGESVRDALLKSIATGR